MSSELFQAIEQIGREKGIEVDTIITAVQDAVVAASKKHFRTREELVSEFDRERGSWNIYAVKKVVETVEDPDLEISMDDARRVDPNVGLEQTIRLLKPKVDLGRIAAQAAKQVIYQKVREAERDNVYKEYNGRVGELINGVVKRFERGDIVLDLGRAEALLPRREQSRADHYNQDDRVRAVIVNVDRAARGPQVIASRTDNLLLMKLFEMEVPEIYDGTVIIESIARDPGDRAKVAVRSKEKDIDPVGACVGIKGSRVQAIIRELRGEKIDIVQWSEDPSIFVANALNPAKVGRVTILDEQENLLEVTVEDSQLSQAIGKKGQNVRLASQLIGWRIEIKSETDKKKEIEDEIGRIARGAQEIRALPGVGEKLAGSLLEHGYKTLEELVAADLGILCSVPGIGDATGARIQESARQAIQARDERLAREREEAARKASEQAGSEEEETPAPGGEEASEPLQGSPGEAGPAEPGEPDGAVKEQGMEPEPDTNTSSEEGDDKAAATRADDLAGASPDQQERTAEG